MTSTADSLCLQLFNSHTFIFLTSTNSLRGERDRHLGLLQSLAGQIDRLDSEFTTLDMRARDSRASLHCGAGPLFEKFHVFAQEDSISGDAFLPPSTE